MAANIPNLGFIEQAWRALMRLLGGPERWTLASRANAAHIVIRVLRSSRSGY